MEEGRKRYVTAGILVGAVVVGLTVLARKTPRDQWGETLGRVASDAVAFVRSRYGSSEPVVLVERTLAKLQEDGRGDTALTRAFAAAAAETGKNGNAS
jgi:hypothetical protein